jgi:hypothetical protein
MKIDKSVLGSGYKKGQVTITNLIALVVTFLIYFIVAVPLLTPLIDDVVADLEASPNEFTSVTVMLLYIVPFLLLLMILITGINYAVPQREGRY